MKPVSVLGPKGVVFLRPTVEMKKGKEKALINPDEIEEWRGKGWEKVGDKSIPDPVKAVTPVEPEAPVVETQEAEEPAPEAPSQDAEPEAETEKELTKTDVKKMSEEELQSLVEDYNVDVDLSELSSLTKKREAVVAALFPEE